jgi:cell division protein FtsB
MDFSKKEEKILLKKVNQLQQISRENQKLREEIRRLSEIR